MLCILQTTNISIDYISRVNDLFLWIDNVAKKLTNNKKKHHC